MHKSPFLIIKNFISPLECETIVESLDTAFPNYDEEGKALKTILHLPVYQNRLWQHVSNLFDKIENYYNVEIDSITPIDFEWYPQNCADEKQRCENSIYINNKWKILNNYDFTMIVFLKDYNDTPDFDEQFECYGGKLEIINHKFSFNPSRGTAVLFPSNQYFINRTTSPELGDAFQMRLHLTCENRFKYNKDDYQGNYSTWFKGLT